MWGGMRDCRECSLGGNSMKKRLLESSRSGWGQWLSNGQGASGLQYRFSRVLVVESGPPKPQTNEVQPEGLDGSLT